MSVPPAMYSTGASSRPACARSASAESRSPGRSSMNGCMSALPLRASDVLDREHDVVVRAAAADVAAHPIADFLGRIRVALCDAGDAGHDLSRRAIATLESVTLDECGLQRVELTAFC